MIENRIYIIKAKTSCYSIPIKIKILEVTDKTYYIRNLDSESNFRKLKEDFDSYYKIIEEVDIFK